MCGGASRSQSPATDKPQESEVIMAMQAREIIESETFEGAIEDLFDQRTDAAGIRKWLEAHGHEVTASVDGDLLAVDGTWMVDCNRDHVKGLGEWINSADVSRVATEFGIEQDFNASFWAHPAPLFHATSEENVDLIRQEGLNPMQKTRGLSNRGVGGAVFTVNELEDLGDGSYGNDIFEIDTPAMKADGYAPTVAQEPDVEEYELASSLAHRLGLEDFHRDSEHGMLPSTVIVYGAIPAKYLKLLPS